MPTDKTIGLQTITDADPLQVELFGVDNVTISGDITAVGKAATDAPVAGNPVLLGGRASTATPSAMSADGDAVPLWLSRLGELMTVIRSMPSVVLGAGSALIGHVINDANDGVDIGDVTINGFPADAKNGVLSSIQVTLSGTPGTVTTVTLPNAAQGFRLWPRSADIRFAIDEDPAAVAASSATTIAANAFAVGAVAKADQWETRLLNTGTGRTLRLRSTTASVVVEVGIF